MEAEEPRGFRSEVVNRWIDGSDVQQVDDSRASVFEPRPDKSSPTSPSTMPDDDFYALYFLLFCDCLIPGPTKLKIVI